MTSTRARPCPPQLADAPLTAAAPHTRISRSVMTFIHIIVRCSTRASAFCRKTSKRIRAKISKRLSTLSRVYRGNKRLSGDLECRCRNRTTIDRKKKEGRGLRLVVSICFAEGFDEKDENERNEICKFYSIPSLFFRNRNLRVTYLLLYTSYTRIIVTNIHCY